MSVIDLTIEKTYMARNSSLYRRQARTCDMAKMEKAVTDIMLSIFEDKNFAPPYWQEEMTSKRQIDECLYEMTTLAYSVCIMIAQEEGEINMQWFEGKRHAVEMQLSYVDHEYAYYVMLEAFLMIRLFAQSIPHSSEYLNVLEQACENRRDLFRKIEMCAIEKRQKQQYAFAMDLLRPTTEMVFNANVDWVFNTHAFKESYIKVWLDEYAHNEREKIELITRMEKCFDDYVRTHEKIRKEVDNEGLANF